MKEIVVNVLGAFLLVYMVLALSIFVIIMSIVMGFFIIVEYLLNFLSNFIKGKNIILK